MECKHGQPILEKAHLVLCDCCGKVLGISPTGWYEVPLCDVCDGKSALGVAVSDSQKIGEKVS